MFKYHGHGAIVDWRHTAVQVKARHAVHERELRIEQDTANGMPSYAINNPRSPLKQLLW